MPKVKWDNSRGRGFNDHGSRNPRYISKESLDIESLAAPAGQFYAKYGFECAECFEFVPKGELAGYNECDEVVCDGCFVPYHDRY